MSRRSSTAPSPHLHAMTATWSKPVDTDGEAPGEVTSGGLTYVELCKLHDVGRDWTDTKKKLPNEKMRVPVPKVGPTCKVCFVAKAVNGDCMC